MSVEVPREFSAYSCRVIVIPLQEVVQSRSQDAEWRGQMRIGSMKDEISLPENFEQEFSGLDAQVSEMFEGAMP